MNNMFNRIGELVFNPLFRTSWKTVIQLWKPLAGWTILVYAVFTAFMAPLLGFLLNHIVFRGDRVIVGNDELFTWFLSPSGFTYLFLGFLITLTGIVIRYAGIFQIVTDNLLGRKISVPGIALHIAPRIHLLVKLCAITIGGAILLLIPLLLGLGAIYQVYLTEFDINYYMISTPPEWYSALYWSAAWGFLWLIFAIIFVGSILPALPAYLDGNKTIIQSLRDVWKVPYSETLHFIKAIAVAAGLWILFRILTETILIFIFLTISGWFQSAFNPLRLIALLTGSYLFLSVTLGLIISFFGYSLIAIIITRFYYSQHHPKIEQQVPGFKNFTKKTIKSLLWWTQPVRAFCLILFITVGGIVTSYLLIDTNSGEIEILNISHRSNALGAPENSFAALENSIAVGADMAEIDVQKTADSTIVVIHDADLMRVAADARRIAEINYDEISDLTLLTDQNIPEGKRRIPTLSNYLDRAENQISLMIELKYYGFDPELAEQTVRLIRDKQMEDQVMLMSLSIRAVQQLKEIAPVIDIGYVSAVAVGDPGRLPIDFLAVNHQNITPSLISAAEQKNRPVYVWIVNEQEDMITAIDNGANGLITDKPEIAGAVIEEMGQLTRAERLLLRFGFMVIETQKEYLE